MKVQVWVHEPRVKAPWAVLLPRRHFHAQASTALALQLRRHFCCLALRRHYLAARWRARHTPASPVEASSAALQAPRPPTAWVALIGSFSTRAAQPAAKEASRRRLAAPEPQGQRVGRRPGALSLPHQERTTKAEHELRAATRAADSITVTSEVLASLLESSKLPPRRAMLKRQRLQAARREAEPGAPLGAQTHLRHATARGGRHVGVAAQTGRRGGAPRSTLLAPRIVNARAASARHPSAEQSGVAGTTSTAWSKGVRMLTVARKPWRARR